jgi:hypothetical protein
MRRWRGISWNARAAGIERHLARSKSRRIRFGAVPSVHNESSAKARRQTGVKICDLLRAKHHLLLCLIVLLWGVLPSATAGDDTVPVTREALLGRWRGGDLTDLNCILVFENERAHILTFREDKHLSTVHSWYRIPRRGQTITLGINGEATVLPSGEIKLKLTREFPHITVLREATLRRMSEKKNLSP